MTFRLRSVLLVVAVLAVAMAAAEQGTRDWRARRTITQSVASSGGTSIQFDGEGGVSWITVRNRLTGPGIRQLPRIGYLDMAGSNVSDEDLVWIHGLNSVQCVDLSATAISDAALTHLQDIGEIIALRLNRTKLTDDAVETLARIPFQGIDLSETQVTSKGIERLRLLRPEVNIRYEP